VIKVARLPWLVKKSSSVILAADEEVLLQGTLVEQPLLGEGSNYTGIRRLQEHFVKQGEDATLPKAVAAIHQFICSTLSSKSM